MLRNFRGSLILLFLLIHHAQMAQELHGAGGPKGGGTYQGCGENLVVDLTVTPLGDLVHEFEAVVDSAGVIGLDHQWTFFTDQIMEASGNSVQVTYPEPMEIPVCLTVHAFDLSTQLPCVAATCRFVRIVQDPSCLLLEPDFSISEINGSTITFENTTPDVGLETTVSWQLGPGSATTSISPSHTFDGPGPHKICLTVTAPLSCSTTVCKWLYLGPYGVECETLLQPGFMHFTYESLLVLADTSITSGQDSELTWDLGDGNTATGELVVHVYEPWWGNTFDVCATVDLWGPLVTDTCTAVECEQVVIGGNLASVAELGTVTLKLWPSPTTGMITLSSGMEGPAWVTITDPSGRVVHEERVYMQGEVPLDVSSLPQGLFVLQLTQDGQRSNSLFVKE